MSQGVMMNACKKKTIYKMWQQLEVTEFKETEQKQIKSSHDVADIFDTNMQINFDNKMYNIIHLYNNVLKFSYCQKKASLSHYCKVYFHWSSLVCENIFTLLSSI